MPQPRNHPVLKWEYTYLDDDSYSDGRTPDPALLTYFGVPFPAAVIGAPLPKVAATQSGPWWLSQDPAASPEQVVTTLRVAAYFSLIPVLSARTVRRCDQVEILAVRSLDVPIYDDGPPACSSLAAVRACIRPLGEATSEQEALTALEGVRNALDRLTGDASPSRTNAIRICLVRFPHRPWREGPVSPRICPVILKPERPNDPTPPERRREPEPVAARRALQELADLVSGANAGDRGAVRDWLASDRAPTSLALQMLGQTLSDTPTLEDLAMEVWAYGDENGEAECSFELAERLLRRGQDAQAHVVAERADERGSGRGAHLNGWLHGEAGDLEAAEAAFRRGDQRGNGWAAFRLGHMLGERGEFDEAEDALRRADERRVAPAATALGLLLRERGKHAEAGEALQRADDNGDAEAAFMIGQIADSGGLSTEAEAAWRRADERGHAQAAARLALLAIDRDQFDRAEAACHRAISRGHPKSAIILANLLLDAERTDEAIEVLRNAADAGVLHAASLLAQLLDERGDPGAEDASRRAAELGDEKAAYNLAQVLLGRGKAREALHLLAIAVASDDDEVAVHAAFTIGNLYATIPAREDAELWLRRVVETGHEKLAPLASEMMGRLQGLR